MKKIVLILILLAFTPPIFCQDFSLKNVVVNVESSFRALSVVDNNVAWVSGSKGWIGRSLTGGKTWSFVRIANHENLDFRAIYAFDSLTCLAANAGSPAYIFRTTDGGKNWIVVYQNDDKDAFIDGMDFWNNKKGMVYGDPIGGKMLLVMTNDGGKKWSEAPANQRPELKPGEGSFAASGTGIRCDDFSKVTIVTGGTTSRVWQSRNGGVNWKATDLPIIQGEASTGAFSIVLWRKYGVVVGGDFKNDLQTGKHIYCLAENNNWVLPLRPTRGLRECVELVGNDQLIAVGPQGADLSNDGGQNWHPLSDEKGLHTVRKARNGSLVIGAGNAKICLINKK